MFIAAHPIATAGKKVAYMTIRTFEHSRRSIITGEIYLLALYVKKKNVIKMASFEWLSME